MGMITDETFGNHLRCGRKAFLKATGTPGELHDIERVRIDLDGAYSRRALGVYLARYGEREIVRSPPSLEAAIRSGPRIIVDATATAGNLRSRIQLMERVEDGGGKGAPSYVPVMFVRNDKITQRDKLLLAFQAHALASVLGALPAEARIVHGEEYKVLRVKIEPLVGQVRGLIEQIEADLGRDGPPTLTLNGHCNECEFRGACRGIAEATDDLSLLRGLSGKEIEKLRGRGIATVAQLSHTYRPGRRGKRRAGAARKHDPALQALALREQKVFVLDRPPMPVPRVALYLDVEGVPDRDFLLPDRPARRRRGPPHELLLLGRRLDSGEGHLASLCGGHRGIPGLYRLSLRPVRAGLPRPDEAVGRRRTRRRRSIAFGPSRATSSR